MFGRRLSESEMRARILQETVMEKAAIFFDTATAILNALAQERGMRRPEPNPLASAIGEVFGSAMSNRNKRVEEDDVDDSRVAS